MNGKSSKQSESRIPVMSPSPLRRSGSMRLSNCPPIREHKSDVSHRPILNRHRSLQSLNTASSFSCEVEDDADSVKSFSSMSGASVCSNVSQCDHAHFARNGTTYSGRCKRYVYHCSPHSTETDDYLTPTQRTNRTLRKLRNLLKEAQEELTEKDREIQRLTKEVVELRLLKMEGVGDQDGGVGDGGGDAHSTPPPAITSTNTTHPGYCSSPPLAQSLSDSGHFEDLNSSNNIQSYINQIKTLESTLESLQRQHEDEIRDLKEKHNDKVDSLLQRITDVNDRYYALRPLYEDCKEKLHELEKENEELKKNSSQNHITKIAELETLNEVLLRDKQALLAEIENVNRIKEDLELSKLNHDKLEVENMQLKNKQDQLIEVLNNMEEEKMKDCCKMSDDSLDGISQTEVDLCNGITHEMKNAQGSCEQNDQISLLKENSELKLQIITYAEKIKQLEEQQQKEKDIYMELYRKGIQAAKLMDNEEIQGGKNEKTEDSLIPDLLQKLRVKQEELDNLKDKEYISPDNLLSAKEAVSLWKLARKAMYRRLLESRKEQPKHDPEMTLQFLKSAFYYFLTDRENAQGHLAAIESILGFTDNEKINIERAFLWR